VTWFPSAAAEQATPTTWFPGASSVTVTPDTWFPGSAPGDSAPAVSA
jgi:hypothetical protein